MITSDGFSKTCYVSGDGSHCLVNFVICKKKKTAQQGPQHPCVVEGM